MGRTDNGAISLGLGTGGTTGVIRSANSVLGPIANGGAQMVYAYDEIRDQLIVMQPASNIISIFREDLILKNSFDGSLDR